MPGFIRSREPGTFFVGGIVAGLLLFFVWFALLPSTSKKPYDAVPDAGAAQGPELGGNGAILSAITGSDVTGQGAQIDTVEQARFEDEQDPDAFDGESGGLTDSDAFAEGDAQAQATAPGQVDFLEAHAEVDGVPVLADEPRMQAWSVEVLRDDNQTEILEVNALSAEQALAIVRDYRGNPRVLRGPSTQPLQ